MTVLIIGVGNRDRGDDALGPFVVEAVRTLANSGGIETLLCGGDLSDLPLRWGPEHDVVIVDSMQSGSPLGTTREIDALDWNHLERSVIADRIVSTHAVGVGEVIRLAHILHRLPRTLRIIGVEGRRFEHFRPLSMGLEAAALTLAHDLVSRFTSRY